MRRLLSGGFSSRNDRNCWKTAVQRRFVNEFHTFYLRICLCGRSDFYITSNSFLSYSLWSPANSQERFRLTPGTLRGKTSEDRKRPNQILSEYFKDRRRLDLYRQAEREEEIKHCRRWSILQSNCNTAKIKCPNHVERVCPFKIKVFLSKKQESVTADVTHV